MTNFRNYSVASQVLLATLFMVSGCFDLGSPDRGADNGSASGTGNSPPTIAGTPGGATIIDERYSFTPTATDADGDSLSFSVQSLPGWAGFDSVTGTLSGTPNLGDVGTYSNIQITVSDGATSTSLPRFSVNVIQSASGSATLSWEPPTQNTDGTVLSDLASYRIYYGLSVGNYPTQILVDNPGVTMYMVDNLVPNTYFFVLTSINTGGVESDFSNVATRTVN